MPSVPKFQLSGTPAEIGYQHGKQAHEEIKHSLDLYRKYFKEQAGLEWNQVRDLAADFAKHIERDHEDLLEEMRGIARGSGQDWLDIVALNVRSEIGLASPNAATLKPIDGCTAFSWRDDDGTLWSAQNWDWKSSACSSLIYLDILAHTPTNRPRIKMMTEAGVIGKIGVNELGVSVMLNALKTDLRDSSRIPIHLLLRRLLSLPSIDACLSYLDSPTISNRCASAAHVLITSPTRSISLEILPTGSFTRSLTSSAKSEAQAGSHDVVNDKCYLGHTNHLVYTSEKTETHLWPDSFPRLSTLENLLSSDTDTSSTTQSSTMKDETGSSMMSFEKIRKVLSDRSLGEKGICRYEDEEQGDIVTVFSIAVRNSTNAKEIKAEVVIGRPDEGGELIEFDFLGNNSTST